MATPPSGHQNALATEISEALTYFLDPTVYRWNALDCERRTAGGVNNVTKLVSVARIDDDSPITFVLRVYRNNNHTGRVAWEHLVLRFLNRVANELTSFGAPLGFCFPSPLHSRKQVDQTFEVLSSGASSCLFEFIPGSLAKTASPSAVGTAAGATSAILSYITLPILSELSSGIVRGVTRIDLPAPYHQLWAVHHAISSRRVFLDVIAENEASWFANSPQERRAAFQNLVQRIILLDEDIQQQQQRDCETQATHVTHLIHGDLHYDNVLVETERTSKTTLAESNEPHDQQQPEESHCCVTAVLDFEFVSLEWRIMELAICLSKYLSEPEEDIMTKYCTPFIQAFVRAYAQRLREFAAKKERTSEEALLQQNEAFTFSSFECSHFVDCIALRILSNVVFFVGRAVSGEDVVEGLTSRVEPYARRSSG
ncbi:Hypothetical protein, putative [Bodo saltans]|uniref:Uncharacterized protein n=1 Tax=Bodo saltans TaxID=75058 RepID=A0A0S4IVZ5_BODSA|nr:Hypothetical protein, putative [Bodo saltans]|eukprot:CUG02949.1 Hypothetical protein, putative [Bodo saltans]